jgi:cytochrome P450
VFAPLLGDGIFTQDGKSWERSRALLRPAFHNQDQSLAQIAAATEDLIKLIPSATPVDLAPLFFRFTLDTTSYLLFGQRLGALDVQESDDVSSFAAAFDRGQDYLAKRGLLGGLYWLIDGPDFRRNCKRVHKHVDRLVNNAIRERKMSGDAEEASNRSILDSLLEQTTDPRVLREQCLNVLLAGRDTTACLLSWTL